MWSIICQTTEIKDQKLLRGNSARAFVKDSKIGAILNESNYFGEFKKPRDCSTISKVIKLTFRMTAKNYNAPRDQLYTWILLRSMNPPSGCRWNKMPRLGR